MSFTLSEVIDDISNGTINYLERFQLTSNEPLNFDFVNKELFWSSPAGSNLIIFLYINSTNLLSSVQIEIEHTQQIANPVIQLINSAGTVIGTVYNGPWDTGYINITFTIGDYISNVVNYDEINIKIIDTFNTVNGKSCRLKDMTFVKNGPIETPPPTPPGTPPPEPVQDCPDQGFASLFPTGNKMCVNVVNNGTDVQINNDCVQFTSSCPIHNSGVSLSGVSGHSCAGKVDYFKLYDDVDALNLPVQSYVNYANNAVNTGENELQDLNKRLPLGYNFFGQFMVHDMTSNPTSSFSPFEASFVNRLTMHFDLDCLYGPDGHTFYYHENKFIINDCDNDLPRNHLGKPIIPDPRNDENYVIAQMHLLFMKFHNKLIDFYKPTIEKSKLFKFVKQQVIYHYQWLIVNDFLPRWVDNNIIQELFSGFQFDYKPDEVNKLPLEFAVAVGRTGHFIMPNTIRLAYDLILSEEEILSLRDGKLPQYVIDWTNFFPMKHKEYDINFCTKYNGKISEGLSNMTHIPKPGDLPSCKNNLLLRNLLRAQQFELGSGQDYASKLGINIIPDVLMKQYDTDSLLETSNLFQETPLILYAVKEAEIYRNGENLTGVGGRIFAETILAILFKDECSYLNTSGVWKPLIGHNDCFTFADMINYIYT